MVVLQVNGQTINTMELADNLTRGDNRAPIECRYMEVVDIEQSDTNWSDFQSPKHLGVV